jgi:endonuclease III
MELSLNNKNCRRINSILDSLSLLYPQPKNELNYEAPFQLLVGTILSAQATDKKVNEITAVLFLKCKTPEDFLELGIEGLEKEIKHINYYRTKARHIITMCGTLLSKYKGNVPKNRDDLMSLAGVGRKTANVLLSYAFNIPAIAVDTHVFRVGNRIGLTSTNNVLDAELELEKVIPKERWSEADSCLVLHGRRVCLAKKPKCDICPLTKECKFFNL